MVVKYKLKDLAADFGVTPKEIGDILTEFFEKPKSNTQVLTDEELNVVFDCMTQAHQISSLEQVFAVQPAKKQEEKPEPKAEAKPAAPKVQNPKPEQDRKPAPKQPQQA